MYIVHQGTGEQEKVLKGEVVFKGQNMEEREVMLGGSDSDTDSSLSENNHSGYEKMESGRNFVAMFVAGLNELKQCELLVPQYCSFEYITILHLYFESQNETLTTKMLGNEATVRTVDSGYVRISPHDAYVSGYCTSLSECQWKLVKHQLGDEHMDMMKQAIASWGCDNGRIITVDFSNGRLTTDGIGHLWLLPRKTLSDLSELNLDHNNLDSQSCEVLAHFLSSLPHLEILRFRGNKIGCDDARLLSQSLHSNTTLRVLNVAGNNIGDRGGCNLAKAISINKGLLV